MIWRLKVSRTSHTSIDEYRAQSAGSTSPSTDPRNGRHTLARRSEHNVSFHPLAYTRPTLRTQRLFSSLGRFQDLLPFLWMGCASRIPLTAERDRHSVERYIPFTFYNPIDFRQILPSTSPFCKQQKTNG